MQVLIRRILQRAGPFVTLLGLAVLWTRPLRDAHVAVVRVTAGLRGSQAIGPRPGRVPPIVTVTGHDCRGRDIQRSGFVATVDPRNPIAGIITTLHGVVGCRSVSAQIDGVMVQDLLVAMVDVRRDVAFLAEDAASAPLATAAASAAGTSREDQRATANRRFEIDLRRAPAAALGSVADAADLPTLSERRSPDPRIAIHAPATGGAPEAFGAPVVDATGANVGVRNGITRAARPLSWVLALDDIDWTPPIQNETEMDRLATLTTLLW